ncbi:rho GDP-dissociation inhibitor 1-like, partial [Cornus florida]|uniref:rho GDP-dissociation inhibitor 1-like n=1 Tax=Cornus florida TaxID=4283 RepID=UPI0028968955
YHRNSRPDVKILSLSILSPGRPGLVLPVPEAGNPKGLWFTLKEGIPYNLRFSIQVSNNIVCGLKYTNTVWKTGIKAQSICSEHLVLSQSLTYMRCQKRLLHLVFLQEGHIQQDQRL